MRDIENRVAFEERDRLRIAAVLPRPFPLILGNEPIGKADGPAPLSLADAAAKLKRLLEGEPDLCPVSALVDGVPLEKDVDPGIGLPCPGITRHRQRGIDPGPTPWLNQRHDACFKFGDDPVGDIPIKSVGT